MTPSRDELRRALEGTPAPAPRPEFVDRLAHRLEAMDQVTAGRHVPVFRRPPAFGFMALAAAAALVALLFAVLPGGDSDRRVNVTGEPPAAQPEHGEPGPTAPPQETTTTTPANATTSTVPGATPTTRPGSAPPSAGGAASPAVPMLPSGPVTTERPTDTTRPAPATTTTTTAEPEVLNLNCVAGQPEGRPGVQCTWSQSTSPAFYGYRLWRATGTEAKQTIYSVSDRTTTTYIDRPVAGVQHYMVEAYDTGGRVSGRSAVVEVTCC